MILNFSIDQIHFYTWRKVNKQLSTSFLLKLLLWI